MYQPSKLSKSLFQLWIWWRRAHLLLLVIIHRWRRWLWWCHKRGGGTTIHITRPNAATTTNGRWITNLGRWELKRLVQLIDTLIFVNLVEFLIRARVNLQRLGVEHHFTEHELTEYFLQIACLLALEIRDLIFKDVSRPVRLFSSFLKFGFSFGECELLGALGLDVLEWFVFF